MPETKSCCSLNKVIVKNKKHIPLVISVFILSIFIGIFLSLLIKYALEKNPSLMGKIQAQEETERLDYLLETGTIKQ